MGVWGVGHSIDWLRVLLYIYQELAGPATKRMTICFHVAERAVALNRERADHKSPYRFLFKAPNLIHLLKSSSQTPTKGRSLY